MLWRIVLGCRLHAVVRYVEADIEGRVLPREWHNPRVHPGEDEQRIAVGTRAESDTGGQKPDASPLAGHAGRATLVRADVHKHINIARNPTRPVVPSRPSSSPPRHHGQGIRLGYDVESCGVKQSPAHVE